MRLFMNTLLRRKLQSRSRKDMEGILPRKLTYEEKENQSDYLPFSNQSDYLPITNQELLNFFSDY
jgi:hypothetical protein